MTKASKTTALRVRERHKPIRNQENPSINYIACHEIWKMHDQTTHEEATQQITRNHFRQRLRNRTCL